MMLSQQTRESIEIGLQLRRWHGDGMGWRIDAQYHLPHRRAVAFGDETGRGAENRCAAVLADGLAQVKPQHRVAPGLNGRRFIQSVDAVQDLPLIGVLRIDAQFCQRV